MIEIAATLLVLTALLAYLNRRWLKLPMTVGVMASSMGLSLVLVALSRLGISPALDDRARAFVSSIDFPALLMQGMLSLLLFAGALHVDMSLLRSRRWLVALLAFLGTTISTAFIGGALWLALPWIGLGLPLLDCLLFGALISPTDPIAVIGMLKSAGAPPELGVVIAGESLFNDGVGVVLFLLLMDMTKGGTPSLGAVARLALQEVGGGLLFGALLGYALTRLLRTIDDYRAETLLTLAAVFGGYALANDLGVSGPLAMVVTGLVVGNDGRANAMSETTRLHVDLFWELVDEILNAVLFVVVGLEVVTIRFPVDGVMAAIAGAATIVVALLARWLTVGLPTIVFGRLMRLPSGSAAILTWGGLRGGISIALAMAVPPDRHQQALLALTYCVVAFSILVQGLSFGALSKRWLR